MRDWKTSFSGIAVIVSAIAKMITTKTVTAEDVTAVITGIGLVLAKDASFKKPDNSVTGI